MITEDYVSFETAKLLKKKGFQQLQNNCGYFTTEMVYSIDTDDNGEHHFAHQYPAGVYGKDKYIAAPTIQMAMKWLREVHKIYIDTNIRIILEQWAGYDINIYKTNTNDCLLDKVISRKGLKDNASYEQTCEAAIKYCLENLI